jgi:antitoxin (DNA-binding transcriptional repressor) of toxin-antitoxin stability system
MPPIQINMHEAKSQLSQLGEKAWAGEKVVIAKAGKPYLDLTPHRPGKKSPNRKPGRLKGRIVLTPDFNRTPADVIDAFEGKA